MTHKSCTRWPAMDKYILLDGLVCSIPWIFMRVVPYFDRMASQNTNAAWTEQCFQASLFVKNVFNLIIKGGDLRFTLNTVRLIILKLLLFEIFVVGYLYLFFEKILCLMLIFLTSMFLVVYNLNSRDRTVARQLNFNHRIVKVQTQNKSAVKWVVLVTCVFLLCYGIFLRLSFLFLTGHKYGNDFYWKITQQVIISEINC